MLDYTTLSKQIKDKATSFGFLEASIASIVIDITAQSHFIDWLSKNFHGSMGYLERNTDLRFNPALLHNNTISIICVKAPYLTKDIKHHMNRLQDTNMAYVSSYALGRDYHKVVKQQLNQYAKWINTLVSEIDFKYRAFTDSAPILEIELAKNSGLGWRGKNTLLLHKQQGSLYFLGEIFTNLPLIIDSATSSHCGSCNKCLTACPTNAFPEPYILDATRCISYLTIENKGSIPIEFRKLMGNRVYGCDDCQLVCPWNKFAKITTYNDFAPRNNLDSISLVELFLWNEDEFKTNMQGSAILRIGYISWLRNLAVGLGNAPTTNDVIKALQSRLNHPSELVVEHVIWALEQHQ